MTPPKGSLMAAEKLLASQDVEIMGLWSYQNETEEICQAETPCLFAGAKKQFHAAELFIA